MKKVQSFEIESLVKELNRYFIEDDSLISAEGISGGDFSIYAFAYLDADEELTFDRQSSEIYFSAEVAFLDTDDEHAWDKLTYDLKDKEWVKVLEELASKIIDYKK